MSFTDWNTYGSTGNSGDEPGQPVSPPAPTSDDGGWGQYSGNDKEPGRPVEQSSTPQDAPPTPAPQASSFSFENEPGQPVTAASPQYGPPAPSYGDEPGVPVEQKKQTFDLEPGQPIDGPPLPDNYHDAPPQDQGGGHWWDKAKDIAGKVTDAIPLTAAIKSGVDDLTSGTYNPVDIFKDAASSELHAVGGDIQTVTDVGKRGVGVRATELANVRDDVQSGDWGAAAKDALSAASPVDMAKYADYVATGNQGPLGNDEYNTAKVISENPYSALLPGTGGSGNGPEWHGQSLYDLPVVGGVARSIAGAGGALNPDEWGAGPSINVQQLEDDLKAGMPLDEAQQKYQGNVGLKVLAEVTNPVNFVEVPGVAEALKAFHGAALGRATGPLGDAVRSLITRDSVASLDASMLDDTVRSLTAEGPSRFADMVIEKSFGGGIGKGGFRDTINNIVADARTNPGETFKKTFFGNSEPGLTVQQRGLLGDVVDVISADHQRIAPNTRFDVYARDRLAPPDMDTVIQRLQGAGFTDADAMASHFDAYRTAVFNENIKDLAMDGLRARLGGLTAGEVEQAGKSMVARIYDWANSASGTQDAKLADVKAQAAARPQGGNPLAAGFNIARDTLKTGLIAWSPRYYMQNLVDNTLRAVLAGGYAPIQTAAIGRDIVNQFTGLRGTRGLQDKWKELTGTDLNIGETFSAYARGGKPVIDQSVPRQGYGKQIVGAAADKLMQHPTAIGKVAALPSAIGSANLAAFAPFGENIMRESLLIHRAVPLADADIRKGFAQIAAQHGTTPGVRDVLNAAYGAIQDGTGLTGAKMADVLARFGGGPEVGFINPADYAQRGGNITDRVRRAIAESGGEPGLVREAQTLPTPEGRRLPVDANGNAPLPNQIAPEKYAGLTADAPVFGKEAVADIPGVNGRDLGTSAGAGTSQPRAPLDEPGVPVSESVYQRGGARQTTPYGEAKSYPTGMGTQEIRALYGPQVAQVWRGVVAPETLIGHALAADNPLEELARYRAASYNFGKTVPAEQRNAFENALSKAADEYKNPPAPVATNGAHPPISDEPGVPVTPPTPAAAPAPAVDPQYAAALQDIRTRLPAMIDAAWAHGNAEGLLAVYQTFNNYGLNVKVFDTLANLAFPFNKYQTRLPFYLAQSAARYPGLAYSTAQANETLRQANAKDIPGTRGSLQNKIFTGRYGVDYLDALPWNRPYDEIVHPGATGDTSGLNQSLGARAIRGAVGSGVLGTPWRPVQVLGERAGILDTQPTNVTAQPIVDALSNIPGRLPDKTIAGHTIPFSQIDPGTVAGDILSPAGVFEQGVNKAMGAQGDMGLTTYYAGEFAKQMIRDNPAQSQAIKDQFQAKSGPLYDQAVRQAVAYQQQSRDFNAFLPVRTSIELPDEPGQAVARASKSRDVTLAQQKMGMAEQAYNDAIYTRDPAKISQAATDAKIAKDAYIRTLQEPGATSLGTQGETFEGKFYPGRTPDDPEYRTVNKALDANGKPTPFDVGENPSGFATSQADRYVLDQQLKNDPWSDKSLAIQDTIRESQQGFDYRDPTTGEVRHIAGSDPFVDQKARTAPEGDLALNGPLADQVRLSNAYNTESDIKTGRELSPQDRQKLIDYERATTAYAGARMVDPGTGQTVRVNDYLNTSRYYDLEKQAADARANGNAALAGQIQGRINEIRAVPQVRDYLGAVATAGKRDEINYLNLRKDDALLNPDIQNRLAPLPFDVLPRDQSQGNVKRDRAYYGLDGQHRAAYDAYQDVVQSDVAQKYFTLEQQLAAQGYQTPESKAWLKEHGAEYTTAHNAYNDALRGIQQQTGVNPLAVATTIDLAQGKKPPSSATIPDNKPVYTTSGSGGGNGSKTTQYAPGSTKSKNGPSYGSGGKSSPQATTAALGAKSDFYAAYADLKARDTKLAARARQDPDVQKVLSGLHSAAEWKQATTRMAEIAAKPTTQTQTGAAWTPHFNSNGEGIDLRTLAGDLGLGPKYANTGGSNGNGQARSDAGRLPPRSSGGAGQQGTGNNRNQGRPAYAPYVPNVGQSNPLRPPRSGQHP